MSNYGEKETEARVRYLIKILYTNFELKPALTPIFPYQDAFWTPGSSPASAFIRNWYCPKLSLRNDKASKNKHTRHSPNSQITLRPRPLTGHRFLTVVGRV